MQKIKSFLLDNEYNIYEITDNIIEGNNEFLRIMIIKHDNEYLIRNASLCYFDRWANSGCEFKVTTEDEVIDYFQDKTKCLVDAISELADAIVEDDGFSNDYTQTNSLFNYLSNIIKQKQGE